MTAPNDGYNRLVGIWDTTRNLDKGNENSLTNLAYGFWHAGNTLDTFADYLDRDRPDGYKEQIARLASEGIEIFTVAVGFDPRQEPPTPLPTEAWFDDYGWWGIAFLKVYIMTGDDTHLQCGKSCWTMMAKGGRGHEPNKPLKNKGTWNHYPGGNQNLITNALFLSLSAWLYLLTHDSQYLTGACEQFEWFYEWFNDGALRPQENGGYLINPSTEFPVDVDKEIIQSRSYDGKFWTGDQGAVIGALTLLLAISKDAAPRIDGLEDLEKYLVETCDRLALGMTGSNVMVDSSNGVLFEPSWKDLNGATGKGVLMRYLGGWLRSRGNLESYAGFIRNNSMAATTDPGDDGYFRFDWSGNGKLINSDLTQLEQLTRQCASQDAYNAWLLLQQTAPA